MGQVQSISMSITSVAKTKSACHNFYAILNIYN